MASFLSVLPSLSAAPSKKTVERRLFGDLARDGYAVSESQFWTESLRPWKLETPPDSLIFCLNSKGYGYLQNGGKALDLTSGVGVYAIGGGLSGHRAKGETHRFLTFVISASVWMSKLDRQIGLLRPEFATPKGFVAGKKNLLGILPKAISVEKLARQLAKPPVSDAARSLWIESKVGELLCEIAFAPAEEKFCARYQRVTQERVAQTVEILRSKLNDPPNLPEIGRQVGCSPFHLSRIFSAETGRTIPQFLRHLRMERASELLQSGRFNVTETAFEVGYASLSHFSKSYFETFGILPKDGSRLAG